MSDRLKESKKYLNFLLENDNEKEKRDEVIRPGVIHRIHLNEDAQTDDPDLSDYYTKTEIDALLLSVTGALPTCLTSLARHSFLMYDEVDECWKNQLLDLDFEDSINYECSNMWEALAALIRIEDSLAGNTIIVEDSL